MVTIATWNVNSITVRLLHLLSWLKEEKPDIVLLQELKCVTEKFPFTELEELGYNAAVHGQKAFNGVAILSKFPLEDVMTTLPGDGEDVQSRYVEAVVTVSPAHALRVASVYVPNGQEVGSDKFAYKLSFLDRLAAHFKRLLELEEILVIGGDYNIAPGDQDVFDPAKLANTVCFHPKEQEKFHTLLNLGTIDAFRMLHPEAIAYSWWDYRAGNFQQNKGMRIDHLLLSPEAADRLESAGIHVDLRGLEKASDHAPVICSLAV